MSGTESVVIKIGSARYVVPIINLIRDRMWEYGQHYLRGELSSIILLFVCIRIDWAESGDIYHGIQSD